MADEKDDKPFLSRWSERKRRVQAEEELAAEVGEAEREQAAAAPLQEDLEANRAAAETIDLETLTDTSDYAPFFRPGVPAALKHAALRKLWRSNPVFAVLDGLNDHDLDYRWPDKGSEVIKTAWKVGRGFLTSEDQAATEERAAARPAGESVIRSQPQTDEKHAEAPTEEPAEEVPEREDADAGASTAPDELEGQDGELEPVRVGLARRLDFAAFGKPEREDPVRED